MSQTLYERWWAKIQNHPVLAAFGVAAVLAIGLGAFSRVLKKTLRFAQNVYRVFGSDNGVVETTAEPTSPRELSLDRIIGVRITDKGAPCSRQLGSS